MGKPLTIVARIEAKKDAVELVRGALLKLIDPTHKEKGCIQYDLHQDNADPAVFVFFENWESRDLWQDHMNSEHLAAFLATTEGALEGLVVNELTQIP